MLDAFLSHASHVFSAAAQDAVTSHVRRLFRREKDRDVRDLLRLAGTPKPVLALLNREISRIVNSGDVKDKFASDGADPAPPVSVEQFRSAYHREVAKWEQFTRNVKTAQ